MSTTILDVLEKGTLFLTQKSIAQPRLNMELIVAHELQIQRLDLYLRFDQPLEESQLVNLREKLKKRSQNVPLQHITGIVHFGKNDFQCDSRALIPRPETEELVSLVLKESFPKPTRILDLGCGSGVLGLSLAHSLGTDCEQLILADLSTAALELAQVNSQALNINSQLIHSDLFTEIHTSFDLIVANLPYIAESDRDSLEPEVLHDPEIALFGGPDGLSVIRPFVEQCHQYLNPGGLVALEVGYNQGDLVADLLRQTPLTDIRLAKDLSGIARFPLARKA